MNRRAAEGIDGILWEPQRNVALIKECYPTYLHRRDRQGHREFLCVHACMQACMPPWSFRRCSLVMTWYDRPPTNIVPPHPRTPPPPTTTTTTIAVYVELLGRINLKKLKANGVTVPEMLRFYTFLTEYIWRVLEPDEGEVRACVHARAVVALAFFLQRRARTIDLPSCVCVYETDRQPLFYRTPTPPKKTNSAAPWCRSWMWRTWASWTCGATRSSSLRRRAR